MAKKKRRSTGGPTGAEKQEARQRRLEEKRAARAAAAEAQRKQAQRERFVRYSLFALLAFGIIWFFFLRHKAPTEFGGHEVLASSQAGVGVHTEDPVDYDTVPPVAGSHSKTPAPCGVHSEQIPNENEVHTLEHGAVGLLYDPTLAVDQIRELESIVGGYTSHTFSAPYDGMDSPIVVVAWGYRMPLDKVDRPAIQGFIDEFRQHGPEDIDCPNTSDSPFQADESAPTDTVSPGAEVSPSPERSRRGSPSPGAQEGTPEPEES